MKKLFSVRTIILAGGLLLQLSTLCFHSRGAPGDVDLSFDPGSGVNGTVRFVALRPDGKVLIGGEFTTVKGLARSGIARLNADGSGDATFNAGTNANGYLRSVALQSDGKVLIGGQYIGNGTNRYSIARLNADGSLDSSFNPVVGPYDTVWSVALQSDGKVLIGGSFSTVNGATRNRIARLNANGSLDNTFNPGTGVSGAYVSSIALQPDGKVLIGGDFHYFNGGAIARLNANGSLDSSFTGAVGPVSSINLQPDGKVLVGDGYGIARLNSDGSPDTNFNANANAGWDDVAAIVLQPDGKVLIGGDFTIYDGANRDWMARLNANGSLDSSFNPGFGYAVSSVALQPDGKMLIGRSFPQDHRTSRYAMARLTANGSVDSSFDPGAGLDDSISSLVVVPNGKVLFGGVYTHINGTNRYGGQLNADGSRDSSFIGSSFNPDISVFGTGYSVPTCLLVQSDGKVLIGGYTVTTIVIDPDGDTEQIYGSFLARFNANDSLDSSFNPGIGASCLALQPDGKIVVDGRFRLNADGSLDSSFNDGTVVNGTVSSVALQPDGKVLIGGDFYTVNGTNHHGISRRNSNGSLDGSFNPGTGVSGDRNAVYSIVVQSDGKVLIGGSFTTVNGTNRNNIARLNANGSLDLSFNPGTGADDVVRSIALQSDGKVLIGGDFNIVNGVARPRVARLYGDSVAPSLNIARSNAFVIVSWASPSTGFVLQQNTDLKTTNWTTPFETVADNGTIRFISAGPVPGTRFFRLFKP